MDIIELNCPGADTANSWSPPGTNWERSIRTQTGELSANIRPDHSTLSVIVL